MAKQKPVRPAAPKPAVAQQRAKPAAEASGKSAGWLLWIPAILLLVYLAYQPALQNDFVNWDDPTYVTENPLLLRPTPENKAALWRQPVSLNYHPLTMLSLSWDMNSAKPQARPFIATNILLHVCNTALVFLFAYFLSRRRVLVGVVSAVLFGIHPMHVESVAWVSERKDVLYAFFFLAALLSYLRYLRRGGVIWLAATFGLFVLSCLSKAMAVSLPLVLLLLDFYDGRLWQDRKIAWRPMLEKLPFLAVSLYFGVKAVQIQSAGAIGDFQAFTLIERMGIAAYGFLFYLYKLFLPPPMVTFYPYPDGALQGNLPGYFYALPLLALAVVGGSVWALKKSRVYLLGIGFYLLTVALVLQFISVGMVIAADRYTYLPYVGLGLILAVLFDNLWQNKTGRLAAFRLPVAAVAVLFCGWLFFLTRQQVAVWKNSETLWTHNIEHYPNAAEPYKNRGNYRGRSGNLDGALADLSKADALGSHAVGVFTGLGNCYGSKGAFDKALDAYNRGLEFHPEEGELYYNRGVTHEKMKNYAAALEDFDKALPLLPEKATQITGARAYVKMNLEQYDGAIRDYDTVIAQTGGDVNAFLNRGVCKYKLGDRNGALTDLEKAAQLSPQDATIQQNINIIKSGG
ncbi:MAG: tetratricopeptide repeat protein [Saprospiraceae bacterium]|nr:tetratricopeptide repeat protein [Saprospiraceae bacterium]